MKKYLISLFILLAILIPLTVWGWGVVMMGGGVEAAANGATDYTQDANIVSWWNFDDAGSPAEDGDAANNDLTWSNSPTQDTTNEIEGTACVDVDDGDFDAVYIADADMSADWPYSNGNLDDFTVLCWVRYDDENEDHAIFSNFGVDKFTYSVYYEDGGDVLEVKLSNNGWGWGTYTGSTNTAAATWYFVALVWDETTKNAKLWLGTAAGVVSKEVDENFGASLFDTDSSFYFSYATCTAADWCNGKFDMGAIFQRTLSEAELNEIRINGLDGGGYP